MEDTQNKLYARLAQAMALLIYRRCIDRGDGIAVYEHFNDNRLGVPADALARLGVMRPIGPDKWLVANAHEFITGWQPSKPQDLSRHSAEPSIFDLTISLCLLVDWDSQYMSKTLREKPVGLDNFPPIDLLDHRRFSTSSQRAFDETAFRFATLPLIDLGLGSWSQEGGFKLVFSLTNDRPIDLADTYFETRHNMAKRMGGVQMLFPSNVA
ncbi:MAG: hypothetical protein ABJ251_15305 [Paracoccaceae bacterium]